MLAVHPAYWGRKHGKELVKWGLELARIDGVKQGLTGSELGMGLYKSLGFELKTELVFEGDEDMPEGLRLWTLVFDPAAHKASSR